MPRLSRTLLLRMIAVLLALAAGAGCETRGRTEPDRGATPSGDPTNEQPQSGAAPSRRCVEGWTSPPPGSALANLPLRIIRRTMGLEKPLIPTEIRYFVGPESPRANKEYLKGVKRWYVEGYLTGDQSFRGRWIVEQREFGSGVAAVAPPDTTGFRSPDWVGFQYEAADPTRRTYPGLPGKWAGTPYDFVKGGEDLEIRGLPKVVIGCLDGS